MHEPKRIQGYKGRKGFHTNHKSKVEAAIALKRLIEKDKLTVNSKMLITELKNFVARGNSYSAKPGQTDDLVMSLLIAIRMITYIGTFEDEVFSAVNNSLSKDEFLQEDEYDSPMPVL